MPRNIWATNGGIPLGYVSDRTEGEPPRLTDPLRYTGDRHLFTVAPSGSGKTMRMLIAALEALRDWSIVVVDIKSDLRRMTEAHRRACGNKIITLNAFNEHKLGSDGFNVVRALKIDDDLPDDALELAESTIPSEGRDPHWPQGAQELEASVMMYVRLVIPNGSFSDVRQLLGRDDAGIRNLVKGGKNLDPRQLELFERNPDEYLERNPDYRAPVKHNGKLYPGMLEAAELYGWPEIATKAARFGGINAADRELHSIISTALVKTRWADSRHVSRDLSSPNVIDWTILKQQPTTVYLQVPARRLRTHTGLIRLYLGSIVQQLMKDTSRSKVPVLLMCDEYFALAEGDGFPVISRNMAMFRGYGIKLWTVWQDLAQAEMIYGKGFESFVGNAGVAQFFAPQDVISAEYVSRRTGQTTRQFLTEAESRNPNAAMPQGQSISRSASQHFIPMPLMMPQDVRNMDDGYSVIFSHAWKGAMRCYTPWPGDVRHLQHIMQRNPAG